MLPLGDFLVSRGWQASRDPSLRLDGEGRTVNHWLPQTRFSSGPFIELTSEAAIVVERRRMGIMDKTNRILLYDIEIKNAIPDKKGLVYDGIRYCQGWGDHAGMGVSVIGAWDYATKRPLVFFENDLRAFELLAQDRDLVVGFNQLGFDIKVLRAAGIDIPDEKNYDLLRAVWEGVGLGPEFNPRTHGGYGLDACCRANFGTRKTGDGALAPIWWQQGRQADVINYCLADVMLTKQLFDFVVEHHFIVDPKGSETRISVKSPFATPAAPAEQEPTNVERSHEGTAGQTDGH